MSRVRLLVGTRKGAFVLTAEQVQSAVRIASVVHAVAATLDGENALAGAERALAA